MVQPLPPSVRRLWQAAGLGAALMVGAGAGAVEIGLRRADVSPPWPPVLVPVALGLVVAAFSWVWADLRWRSWRFELTDDWFQARWGVVSQFRVTVPRNRVQTLTSHNGPLDRLLGLTTVVVHTAGAGAPNVSVPHLEDGTVDWLRTELAQGPIQAPTSSSIDSPLEPRDPAE